MSTIEESVHVGDKRGAPSANWPSPCLTHGARRVSRATLIEEGIDGSSERSRVGETWLAVGGSCSGHIGRGDHNRAVVGCKCQENGDEVSAQECPHLNGRNKDHGREAVAVA